MTQDKEILIDSSVLSHEVDSLNEIFRMYIEDINPFIVRFEISKGEFPAEVQNEIRAIYGHLVRATMTKDQEKITRNIEKMRSHSKRALLDCFKYTSILCSDNYDGFMKRYENVDLTYLDKGNFLTDVTSRCTRARKALQDAKVVETSNISEEELFELYQNAYIEFEQLDAIIKSAEETAAYLQHKATQKDKMSKRSYIIGIAGFVVGIAGFVVGLIGIMMNI